jgi:flagellar biosynthetic protein FliR
VNGDGMALLDALPDWSFAFVLLLGRIGGAVALLPGLGEAALPPMLRAGTALALTALLLPVIGPSIGPPPAAALQTVGMLAAELGTGLWFGWLARLFAIALPVAAQFIAYLLGLSTVLQPSAELGPQSSALARLGELLAPLFLLGTGLYTLPLLALAGSYRLIPAGALLPAADGTAAAVHGLGAMFALALRLAAPFVLAGIVWHLAIGLMSRLVPRIQVYFTAMPGQIFGGLLLLTLLSAAILGAWADAVRDGFARLPGLG